MKQQFTVAFVQHILQIHWHNCVGDPAEALETQKAWANAQPNKYFKFVLYKGIFYALP